MSKPTKSFFRGVEVRVQQDGTSRTIVGILPYRKASSGLPWLEEIMPGAFASALVPRAVVRALRDHDTRQLLGTTTAGTLQLRDTEQGLQFTIQLPDVSYANDLVALMSRGDIATSCCASFGFICLSDEWSETATGELQRRLKKVDLLEVSVLSSDAAYPDSQAALRSVPTQYRERLKQESRGQGGCDCDCGPCEEGDCSECQGEDDDGYCDDDSCLSRGCPLQDDDDSEDRSLTWAERTALRIEVLKRS